MNIGPPKPTHCENCEHVHPDTLSKAPTQWMCMCFPRLEGFNAIAPTLWAGKEPYNRCVSINVGHCPLYLRRRDNQKELVDV